MNSMRYPRRFSLFALTAALATPAIAQVPAVQNSLPTREEIERQPIGPDTRGPSRLTVEGGIERAPCPLAEPRFANITFTLSAAQFDNLRVVSPDLLRPAWEGYVGRTVPIAAVCEIRDAAATILRREGYLAAVQVPAQRIEGGVVRFDVLMAKLVAVQVRGDAGRSERLIAGYLEELKGQKAFNEKQAERYLLLARDLPGYDVRLTLRPAGTAPGEVIGEVTVIKTPVSIDANIQNYGSKSVGRFGGLLRAEVYDLLGFGDRAVIGFYATPDFDEQKVLQLGYDMRLGSEGLTVGGRFTYAWTEPDLGPAGAGTIRSNTLVASGEVGYPFLRSQSANLRGALGLEYVDQDVRFNGLLINQDKLRIAYGRLDFESIDRASIRSMRGYSASEPRWRLAGSAELRQGLDILDATGRAGLGLIQPSRADGKASATVFRFSGVGEYRPVPELTFSLAPRVQYAGSALLSYEEFSAGNYTAGRGYDPGTLIGDSGIGFQAELRYGVISPRSHDAFAVQPYVFLDQAWIWNRNGPIAPAPSDPQELTSAGGGVRVAYGDRARLDVTIATPLNRAGLQARRGDTRLLVSLSTRLWPWLR